jgi:hypothetical protein
MASAAAVGSRDAVRVGAVAYRDPILSRASLEAAEMLRLAVRKPRWARDSFVRSRLVRYGPDAARKYGANLNRLTAKGWSRDQALFDSIRLVIADYYAQMGVEAIRAAVAQNQDADRAGLGDDTARQVGCAITGGTTALVGSIVGIFTGGAGSAAAAAGGTLIGSAMQCNREQQQSTQQIAASQAAQAQAQLQQAQLDAATQLAMQQARTKEIATVAVIGGAALVLLLAGYAVIKF